MSMNRRGFMSKVGSFFKRPGDELFYALQVVVNVFGEDDLRQALHRVVLTGGEMESPAQKRAFYKQIAALLTSNNAFFEYGHWDYVTDKGEAEAEFESWVTELEAGLATEAEEVSADLADVDRMSTDKSYVVVTLLFVLERVDANGTAIEMIERHCDDEFLEREPLTELIEAVRYIDFEYSLADAAFIMPGNEHDGISWEDIRGEGWEYLKPVM
jgi:hypothetical protein